MNPQIEHIVCNKDGWYLRGTTYPHFTWDNDRSHYGALRASFDAGMMIVNYINETQPRYRAHLKPVLRPTRVPKEQADPSAQGTLL